MADDKGKKPLNPLMVVSAGGVALAVALLIAASVNSSRGAYIDDPVAARAVAQAQALQDVGDHAGAARLLEGFALAGNPVALLEYGVLLSRGWGVKRDLDAARDHLLRAVQYSFPGRAEAAHELGRVYRKSHGEDCQRIAYEWFAKAREWGFAKASLDLGWSHLKGVGVPVDIEKALVHYRDAASNGSAAAVLPLLMVLQEGGKDSAADPARSVALLAEFAPLMEAQAKAGDGRAARTLARIARDGVLVPADREAAKHWFMLGVRAGDAASMHDLAILQLEAGDAQFQENVDLLKNSAALAYSGAMTALGRLHLEARGGLDPLLSVEWFEKGVAAGHPGAMEEMARLLSEGKLLPRDETRARELAQQGARLGHAGARNLLRGFERAAAETPEGTEG
jgi:TPR repeat protein